MADRLEEIKKKWDSEGWTGLAKTDVDYLISELEQAQTLARSQSKRIEKLEKWLEIWLKNHDDFVANKILSEDFIKSNRYSLDEARQLLEEEK